MINASLARSLSAAVLAVVPALAAHADVELSFGGVDNPNHWFVFAFSDADLPGLMKQPVQQRPFLDCSLENLSDGCP